MNGGVLLYCPECKKEVLNRDSTSCPSCGYPFSYTFIEKLKGYDSETVNQPTLKKSKKKIIILSSIIAVLILAVLIVVIVRLTGTNNYGTELLTNDSINFYVYCPDDWIIQKNDSIISIYIDSDNGENPNISAQMLSLPENYKTIDEYWQNSVIPSFELVFDDVEYKSEEGLTVGGVPAKKYTYITSLLGMKFKTSQVIFFKNLRVYTLTYTATENNYDIYAEVFDTVAKKFKFK